MSTSPRIVLTTLAATGAELPEPIGAAAQQYQRITESLTAIRGTRDHDLAAATLTALDAGRDPFADPAVQQATAAAWFAQTNADTTVETLAAERFRETLADHAADLTAALQHMVDRAVAAIIKAQRTLGDTDPAEPAAVLRLGGKAAEAWGQHQIAAKQLDAINTARGVIGQALRWTEPPGHWRSLRWAALNLDQLDQYGTATPESLARAGISLALADGTETRRRLHAITQQQQDARDALERQSRSALKVFPVATV